MAMFTPNVSKPSPHILSSILSRIASTNKVGANLQAGMQQGIPSIQGMQGFAPMGQMNAQANPMELFGNKEMTIDEFGQKFGLNYSRGYADQQAAAIERAKRDSYNGQLRQVQSGVESSVNNIDRNYYLDGLKANQQQVNSGINAGIEADQELRLAMSRQNAMGDVYRDANNQTYGINDSLGRLEAEKIAYADQLYNDRREQGFKNATNYNTTVAANAATFAEHQRNITNDNRGFALDEGKLMGNYVPFEARPLIQTILTGKDQLNKTKNPLQQQQILDTVNAARIQLSSMGVNVDRIGTTSTFGDALNSISNMNKTMDGQNNDLGLAQAIAKETGSFTDPKVQQLYQTLLQIKKNVQTRGTATTAEKNQANQIRSQLNGMGIDAEKLIGSGVGYGKALSNAALLGKRTLGAIRQDQDIINDNVANVNDRLEIDNTYKIEQGRNANEANQISNDFTLGSEQNAIDREKNDIDRQLGAYDYELGLAEVDYKQAQNEVEMKKVEWEQQSVGEEANAKAATNAVTAELMQMNKAEAIAAFGKHYSNWIDNGVDVIAVMKALGLDGLLEEKKKKSSGGDIMGDFFSGK